MASLVGRLHSDVVFPRRVKVLARYLASLLPDQARVLDVGCGDGTVDSLIQQARPDIVVQGVDVLIRPGTKIPVQEFDGCRLPVEDKSFDVVMFVDVLHHTDDPILLLREARRVARRAVVIKDHGRDGLFAEPTLRLMDWVGNAPHGVRLPYNYWPRERWLAVFQTLALSVEYWTQNVDIYPWPASLIFGRQLHFIARLSLPQMNGKSLGQNLPTSDLKRPEHGASPG